MTPELYLIYVERFLGIIKILGNFCLLSADNDPNMSADVWENLQEIFADLDALSDRYIRTHPLCVKSCNMLKPVNDRELISSSVLLSITMEMIKLSIKKMIARKHPAVICVWK